MVIKVTKNNVANQNSDEKNVVEDLGEKESYWVVMSQVNAFSVRAKSFPNFLRESYHVGTTPTTAFDHLDM